eukprot:4626133-Prymnesium_polylepis.1
MCCRGLTGRQIAFRDGSGLSPVNLPWWVGRGRVGSVPVTPSRTGARAVSGATRALRCLWHE